MKVRLYVLWETKQKSWVYSSLPFLWCFDGHLHQFRFCCF